jgi:hypothetical protein
MQNSYLLLKRHWHWVAFLLLGFFATFFLISQRGMYEFTDSGFFYTTLSEAGRYASSKLHLFSTTDGFYMGYDNSSRSFAHLLVASMQIVLIYIFKPEVGQILYYSFYYFICFYFGQKLLRIMFKDAEQHAISIGSLFLAFNPVSLLLMSLSATGYVYAAFIILAYYSYVFLTEGTYVSLLWFVVSAVYTVTYLRLLPILFVLLLYIAVFIHDKRVCNYKRLVIAGLLVGTCLAPFIIGNIFSLTSKDNIVTSYQSGYQKYEFANYSFKQSFLNSFSNPGGFTPSALGYFYNPEGIPGFLDNYAQPNNVDWLKAVQILFNIGIIGYCCLAFGKNRKVLFLLAGLCSIFFLNTLGFFVSREVFTRIHKNILVFLYNDYGFLQFAQSFLYSFLVVILLDKNRELPRKKLFLSVLVLGFLVVNATPFLRPFYGFDKVRSIPAAYKDTFFAGQEAAQPREASLFLPYHWLKFSWAPYYLDIDFFNDSKYTSLIVPNLRLVSQDFATFYNKIYENISNPNLKNISLFNIKNIFLFKNLQNSNATIDTYRVTNIEEEGNRLSREMQGRNDVVLVGDTPAFNHYRFMDSDTSDYLLYRPETAIPIAEKDFFNNPIDTSKLPVLTEYPAMLVPAATPTINLAYKYDIYNPTKYYLKVANTGEDIALEFNQKYSSTWQLYFVPGKAWEETKCYGDTRTYTLTKNQSCSYHTSILDSITAAPAHESRVRGTMIHTQGNYVGNLFIIPKENIPSVDRNNQYIYLAIYFKNERYYQMALVLSGGVLLLLTLLAFHETLRKFFKKSARTSEDHSH